jgi:hypothetical protein
MLIVKNALTILFAASRCANLNIFLVCGCADVLAVIPAVAAPAPPAPPAPPAALCDIT